MNRTKKNFNNDKPNNNNNKEKKLSNLQINYYTNLNLKHSKEKFITKLKQNESFNKQNPPKSKRTSSEKIPLMNKKIITNINLEKKDLDTEKNEQKYKKEVKDENSVTKEDIKDLKNQIIISNLEIKKELKKQGTTNLELKTELKKGFKDLKDVIIEGFEKLYSLFSNNKMKNENKNESEKKSDDFKIDNNVKKENLYSKEYMTSSSNSNKEFKDSLESISNKIQTSSGNKNKLSSSSEYVYSYKPDDLLKSRKIYTSGGRIYSKNETIILKKEISLNNIIIILRNYKMM